jgi:glycosyltransferase involved in cell wall biosynthesis
MRVTVNALATPSCRQGGSGFYTATLIDGLSRAEGVESTTLASELVAAELSELAPGAAVAVAPPRKPNPVRKSVNYLTAARRPWTLEYPFEDVPYDNPEIVHWPASFMNAPPPPPGARRVVTTHDLQHEFFPRFFSRWDRVLRRMRWPTSARAADMVITISNFSKETIVDLYGVPEERVSVAPLGIRSSLAGGGGPLPAALAGEERWLFYPASPLPAKNHGALLAAFARLDDPGLKLVLTGPTMHSWREVEEGIAEHRRGDRVILLGHVDEAQMSALYSTATGLVFPSLFEGFGLPVLEAMAAGCPVAVSDVASLPELVGAVGSRFDPTDPGQIAEAMAWLVALDGEERRRQIEDGRERSELFSVERMIGATLDAYRAVLA